MGQGRRCPKGWEHGKLQLPFPLAYGDPYPTNKQTNKHGVLMRKKKERL